jgi:transposase
MPKRVKLRILTAEEEEQVRRLAKSRTAKARLVQRARIIVQILDEPNLSPTQSGIRAGFSSVMGAFWVHRFNESGLAGLEDEARAGRPPTHDQKVRSALINLALQKPRTLGYPFELWTLARLQEAFEKREGIHLSDSTIWTWMEAEGFSWKKQQSWFREPEKHDPEFVEKRGS